MTLHDYEEEMRYFKGTKKLLDNKCQPFMNKNMFLLTLSNAMTNCNGPPCTTIVLIVVDTSSFLLELLLRGLLYKSLSSNGSISIFNFFFLHN